MSRVFMPGAVGGALCLVAPAAAASEPPATGIANPGPALVIIAIAAALIAALVLKPTLAALVHALTRRAATRRVHRCLAARSAGLLADFIVPGAYEGLTRIDFAVLTGGGIVCVQLKHYRGSVFGAADDPQWSCVQGAARRQFLNPVIQNAGHVKALENAVAGLPVTGLVVFTGAVDFATPPPGHVIPLTQLGAWLDRLEFGQAAGEDPETAWLSLRAAARTDDESRKDFAAQLSFG